MSGKRYGWVVLITNDDEIQGACITGITLKRSQTSEMVVAVLSSQLSSHLISYDLDKVFDMVIVKNFEDIKDGPSLLSTLNLYCVEKIVSFCPGVVILRQSDHLFDLDESDQPKMVLNEEGKRVLAIQGSPLDKAEEQEDNLKILRHATTTSSSENAEKFFYFDDDDDDEDEQYRGIFWLDKKHWQAYLSEITSHPTSQSESVFSSSSSDWTAIVGMSCRFPGANSTEEYWDLLSCGRNTSSSPPKDRLSLVTIDDDVRANFLKCPIDQFDASFFGISPSEAVSLDPQARLLMEVSWEAFENAGMIPGELKGVSVGVFCGVWLQDYKEYMNKLDIDPNEDFLRKYLGNGFGCTAAKLSFFYGFTGPNISTESGCSSSMVAVDLACKSLQRRECPLAVAAGANILLHFDTKQKVVWAKDGKSKTFDEDANGYARAEGIAVLVLKRYSDAIRDGDNIHGIIRGSAVSQEGLSKSFGTPTIESELKAMREALRNAKVDPSQVDYVEAHATGTGVGDPIEAAAIVKAYTSKQKRDSNLLIGSGKTNIGHTESCSGLAGIIKVLLAMKHETVPAHVNFRHLNPQINFDGIPGEIPMVAKPWQRSDLSKPRIAGVSSFGVTGTDVHVILQEPPSVPRQLEMQSQQRNQTGLQIVTVSAKSLPAFQQLCQLYANYLQTCEKNQFSDFIYTLNTARAHHFQCRKAFLVSTPDQAVEQLSILTCDQETPVIKESHKTLNICFTFPGLIGNVSFHPARNLYKISDKFKLEMDQCDRTWLKIFPTETSLINTLGNIDLDITTTVTDKKPLSFYACLISVQYSLLKLWKSLGVEPTMILGHCIGEVGACLASGVLRLEDAFKILGCSGLIIGNDVNVDTGALLAMTCGETEANELISHFLNDDKQVSGFKKEDVWIDLAGVNAPNQTVVAGLPGVLKSFQNFCQKGNVKCKLLQVDFAMHSRVIQPMWQDSRQVLNEININSPNIPYLSCSTGKFIEDVSPNFIFGLFRNTVQLTKGCKVLEDSGPDVIIEIGVGSALTALTKENLPNDTKLVTLPSFKRGSKDSNNEDNGLLSSLAEIYMLGGNLNWKGFYNFEKTNRKKLTNLPHYPFQRRSFWFENKSGKKNGTGVNGEFLRPTVMHKVHPLLGGVLSSAALVEQRVYQNWMREELAPFIYDHVIGSHVIFPAAGFLEMILATARLELDLGPTGANGKISDHLVLEDFVVHKPLYLPQSGKYRKLQCVYDTNSKRVSIHACHHQNEDDDDLPKRSQEIWKLFASAIIIKPEPEVVSENDDEFSTVDILSMKENCGSKHLAENMYYPEGAAVGINLRGKFKCLKTVYRMKHENATLIEVDFHKSAGEKEEEENSYVAHPLLLDAMIQGFILHTKPQLNRLHVPVKISKLICLRDNLALAGEQFYVYCKTESCGMTRSVSLLNEDGSVVCVMVQMELASTTTKSILEAADVPELESIPSILTEEWQMSKSHDSSESSQMSLEGEWVIFHGGENGDDDACKFEIENRLKTLGRKLSYLNVWEMGVIDLQTEVNNFMAERRSKLEGILFWCENTLQGDPSQPQCRDFLEPLLCVSKFLGMCRWVRLPKVHVISRGVWSSVLSSAENDLGWSCDVAEGALLWGFMRTFRVEMPHVHTKCIDMVDGNLEQLDEVVNEILEEGDDNETEIVFRGGNRFVRRLKMKSEERKNLLQFPSSRYTVQLPQSKIISDLTYVPKNPPSLLGDEQVEVQVKSASLNFKDVLAVMKPSVDFEEINIIGLDFAGVVSGVGAKVGKWKVGDPVFSFNWTEGTIASHLVVDADMITGIPKKITFNEAATLPAVFLTAWHCMVNVAKMKKGQSILIHAASGGVGLMSFQLAKYLGLRVFGTAGSGRKRRFVKSLGIQHVFNSRTLGYGKEILEITKEEGVDMILNCLTGPGFKETSLECCKKDGYFVEIGKMDIWSVEQVKEKRADVQYHIVDVTILERHVPIEVMKEMSKLLEEHIIKPLPFSKYPAAKIVDAMTLLQKVQHIGKVIVEMPKVDGETGEVRATDFFNEQSSYLITGGLGAIGLAVGKWMLENGAKYLILVGRSPPNDQAQQLINEMMEMGAERGVMVITKQYDISDLDQCTRLFEELEGGSMENFSLPPVRGVHHCSGVLSDKLIMNQSWTSFETVLAPKVHGAWNLHQVTRDLPLEFFVVYSSMSSTFGNAGQSNYSAANCYMDALIEFRREMNLPGMSVNWGPWKAGLAEHLELNWTEAFSVEQGIKVLEKLMRENVTSAVVGKFKFPEMAVMCPKYEKTLFEKLSKRKAGENRKNKMENISMDGEKRKPTLSERLQQGNKAGEEISMKMKTDLIRNCVTTLICNLLGFSSHELKHNVPFSDLGMDSLVSIEFTNKLQEEMGQMKLGFVDMEEHGTVDGMTDLLLAIFFEQSSPSK